MQDVLLIGYGGVGAMCASSYSSSIYKLTELGEFAHVDSYILTKGGRARITAVARSNYSAVKGPVLLSSTPAHLLNVPGENRARS